MDSERGPVAGARVTIHLASGDVEAHADVDGVARFSFAAGRALVSASHGKGFGQQWIDFSNWWEDRHEVVLETDRTLRVRVTGPDGSPQRDVTVRLAVQQQPLTEDEPWAEQQDVPRSDANGEIVVPHMQTKKYWPRDDNRRWFRLWVDMLGVPMDVCEMALEDLGGYPVMLTCPEHNMIRVRLWLRPGMPMQSWEDLFVWSEADADECEQYPCVEASADGRSLLAPLGRDWWISLAGGELEKVPDLRVPYQVVDMDLYASSACVYVACLRDVDGVPIANAEVSLWIGDAARGRTDEHGILRFQVPPVYDWNRLARFTVQQRPDRAGGKGEVQLPPEDGDQRSVVDLGVVVIAPNAKLVTGNVMDCVSGLPLQARLSLTSLATGERVGAAVTDEEGRFVVWGRAPGSMRLMTEAQGYRNLECHIASGSQDLQVRLARVCGLCVDVLHDVSCSSRYWEPRLLRDGLDSGAIVSAERYPGRVRYRFSSTSESLCDFVLLSATGGPPLAVLAAQRLQSATQVEAPAATVDLRGKVGYAGVDLALPGIERARGSAYVRFRMSDDCWTKMPFAGPFQVAFPGDCAPEVILVPGHGLPVWARLTTGSVAVQGQGLPVLRVSVKGLPHDAPEHRLRLAVVQMQRKEPLIDRLIAAGFGTAHGDRLTPRPSLERMESQADEAEGYRLAVSPLKNGLGELPIDSRGRFAVLLEVEGAPGHWESVYGRDPRSFEVVGGGAQNVVLEVNWREVQQLLAEGR